MDKVLLLSSTGSILQGTEDFRLPFLPVSRFPRAAIACHTMSDEAAIGRCTATGHRNRAFVSILEIGLMSINYSGTYT